MNRITNADAWKPIHKFAYFCARCTVRGPGRFEEFPDLNISKRPSISFSVFVGRLGRLEHPERLLRVSC
jgi:hypothetical protein